MDRWDSDFVALLRRQNAGEQVGADEYDDALTSMSKEDALYHLLLFGSGIPPATLCPLLAGHWPRPHFNGHYGIVEVVKVFRHAGFVTDTGGVTAPTVPLTIYRGVGPVEGRVKGLSWTLDQDKAAWFATWFAFGATAPGTVYAAEIPPAGVLGILHGRKESEVIVDPRRLRKVRELRQVTREAA